MEKTIQLKNPARNMLLYPITKAENIKFNDDRNLNDSMNSLYNMLQDLQENMQKIHYSTVEPTTEDGKDGDLWIIYKE